MELIDTRRGKSTGTIDKKVKQHGNWYLDAREAKKQLLCDFIGPAQKMRVEVLCNITFREQ